MKAYELLSQPGAWCQGNAARDIDGREVCFFEQCATSWCIWGAMNKCHASIDMMDRLSLEVRTRGFKTIAEYNDWPTRTQEEVVAFLREIDL